MEANRQNYYAVVIVKRTAGCTDNQGSWPWANQQHVLVYFFSEVMENIECIVTGTKRYSSDLPQGKLEVPCRVYTTLFW